MAITGWRHYADPGVAPLCRSWNGSIWAIINIKIWCIPAKQNAVFVCAMEEVLTLYKRPYDEEYPVVCMDESSKQHLKETHQPLPMKPGKPLRYDTEYERNGTSNLFLLFAPLRGWRRIDVTASRTATDWALQPSIGR